MKRRLRVQEAVALKLGPGKPGLPEPMEQRRAALSTWENEGGAGPARQPAPEAYRPRAPSRRPPK
jgi:hypothetical protein